MVSSGFVVVWLLYYISCAVMMGTVYKIKVNRENGYVLTAYTRVFRLYITVNVLTALSLIVIPVIMLLMKIHWYWIVSGVITTLFLGIVSLLTVKRYQKVLDTCDEPNGNGEHKVGRLYWGVFSLGIVHYVLIVLDGSGIVGVSEYIFSKYNLVYQVMLINIVQVMLCGIWYILLQGILHFKSKKELLGEDVIE